MNNKDYEVLTFKQEEDWLMARWISGSNASSILDANP